MCFNNNKLGDVDFMKKVYIFLADGFEEIEGLTVVDIARRAGIEVVMVSVTGKKIIEGAHGIGISADILFENHEFLDADMLVLPGGMPGTNALMEHEGLRDLLVEFDQKKKNIAAICAAPSVLGMNGLLKGKNAVCYPGFEEKLIGANVCYDNVVVADHIITSRGMGTAIDFSLAIVTKLINKEASDNLAKAIIYCA